jgi:hypothetical protein
MSDESARIGRLHLQVLDANTPQKDSRPKTEVEMQAQRVKELAEKKEWVNVRRLLSHQSANRALNASADVDEILACIETHGTIPEPWVFLAARYLEQAHVSKGAFCLEEALLHDHANIAALVAYAETQVALKELDTARKYFAHAAMLDEGHPRALWGLLSVNTQLIAMDKKGMAMSTESAIQLHKFTVQKLVALYEPLAKKGFAHAKFTLASIKAMPAPKPAKA